MHKVKNFVTGVKNFVTDKKVVATAMMAAMATITLVTPAFATEITDFGKVVKKAVDLVLGLVVFGGAINVVLGIRTIAKGVQDDGGGQDAQAVSKGRGQLIAGIIMMAPNTVFKILTTQSIGDYIGGFFS